MRKTADHYLDAVRVFVTDLRDAPDEEETAVDALGFPISRSVAYRKMFVTAEEIAQKLGAPKHFITQCLHKLNLEGLVSCPNRDRSLCGDWSPKFYNVMPRK